MSRGIYEFLRHQPLLQELSDDDIADIGRYAEQRDFVPGEEVFPEGEDSTEIYFVIKGLVELLKWDVNQEHQFCLGSLVEGEIFGQMSFLDGSPRSCAVNAGSETSLLVLSRDAIRESHPDPERIIGSLTKGIAKFDVDRLRDTSEHFVESLRNEAEALKIRVQFGQFFVAVMACFVTMSIVNHLGHQYGVQLNSLWGSWMQLMLFATPMIIFVRKFGYPVERFGLTTANWRPVVVTAFFISLVGWIIFLAACFVDFQFNAGALLVSQLIWWKALSLEPIAYFFHSGLQEFMTRGVIQTSLQRFLKDDQGHYAILVTSILFATSHIYHGFVVLAVTFFAGLGFGYLYVQQKNLLGVTIVHWMLGMILMFLGVI